jgi:hypothetical protein
VGNIFCPVKQKHLENLEKLNFKFFSFLYNFQGKDDLRRLWCSLPPFPNSHYERF